MLAGCVGGDGQGSGQTAAASRPNLIVVMTDDQTLGSFNGEVMPFTTRLFELEGTIFENAFASPPLCCPARAGFLTGQYPHNHGVDANAPGYPLLRDPGQTLPVWLERAGYRTAFVGKFLNGYETVGGSAPAPGWDEWFAAAGPPAYFDYEVSDNGRTRRFGDEPADYSTDVFTDRAIELIDGGGEEPLFLWLALNAPHVSFGTDGPCAGEFAQPPGAEAFRPWAEEPLPRPPSFDEADVSDKPGFVRRKPRLDEADIAEMATRWRCGLAALSAADHAIERLVTALRKAGEWDSTALVFASDNGYFFGEHRFSADKRLPYEAALHVPLAIRLPPSAEAPPSAVGQAVANVDLAPTLLELAGADPCLAAGCRPVDGLSLLPLLGAGDGSWPKDRAILVELDDDYTYAALRTQRYLYSETRADRSGPFGAPALELYDMRRDPEQLENMLRGDPAGPQAAAFADRLERLRGCVGEECR